MPQKPLRLMIRNKDKVTFDEEVESITSKNRKGKFDVLPQHANFISLLNEQLLVRKKGGEEEKVEVEDGVLRVVENRIEVYLGIKAL